VTDLDKRPPARFIVADLPFGDMATIDESELGLGTWRTTFPSRCEQSIAMAIDMGYLHIDTARAYGNEECVQDGVERSSRSQDDLFIATKVHHDDLGYENVFESVEKSLTALGTDSIDLLYVHWPAGAYDPVETWQAFDKLWEDEVIENVGVSNFTVELLKEALDHVDAPILANQVEYHPLFQQEEILKFAQAQDIYLVAYSPLARGRVFEFSEITEVARKHDASEAQVTLAWLRQMDSVIPIPMADIEVHQRENYRSKDLELDEEDIELIESVKRERRLVDPEYAPWNQ